MATEPSSSRRRTDLHGEDALAELHADRHVYRAFLFMAREDPRAGNAQPVWQPVCELRSASSDRAVDHFLYTRLALRLWRYARSFGLRPCCFLAVDDELWIGPSRVCCPGCYGAPAIP